MPLKEGTADLKAEWYAIAIRIYIDQSFILAHIMLKDLQTHCNGRSVILLVIVKAPEVKNQRSRRPGLLRPDYFEKSQSRRSPASSADVIVKVDVTIAPGL
jgi:hypothetical protein